MPPATSPRAPLILRLLLQIIRPETVQVNVHRWVAFLSSFVFCYLIWGKKYLTDWRVFLGGSALVLTAGAISTVITAYLIGWTYSRYPEPTQTRRRLLINSAGLLLMGLVLTCGFLWLFDAQHVFGYRASSGMGPWLILLSSLFDLGLAGFFEIAFAFRQWQTNQLESEQLAQQQLQSQLNEVKQQVNPHFLFNSLNCLSVLIGESPPQAAHFVDELAKVYRYQLHAHRSSQLPATVGLVPLDAELAFIRSYAHLLRTRYGPGLELDIVPAADNPAGSLLPLTLQTLVDNAIQHNTLSAARPLCIHIGFEKDTVCVRNTLHKRTVLVPMSYESLAGLQARYQLLGPAHALRVREGEAEFSVAVPLLLA